MGEDSYEVRVLAYLNPHHVFTLPLRPAGSHQLAVVEHVGLHGVVGQKYELNESCTKLEWQPDSRWGPEVDKAVDHFFKMANRIFFTPKLVINNGSIFDDNIFKFGELTAEDREGGLHPLSQYLKQKKAAMLSSHNFTYYLQQGAVPLPLNTSTINEIIEQLIKAHVDIPLNHWKKIINSQTKVFGERRDFEAKVKAECTPFAAEKIINEKIKVFELCKGADYQYLGITRPKRNPVKEVPLTNKANRIKALLDKAKKGREKIDTDTKNISENNSKADGEKTTGRQIAHPPRNRDYIPKVSKTDQKKTKQRKIELDPWTKKEMDEIEDEESRRAFLEKQLRKKQIDEDDNVNSNTQVTRNVHPFNVIDQDENFYSDGNYLDSNPDEDNLNDVHKKKAYSIEPQNKRLARDESKYLPVTEDRSQKCMSATPKSTVMNMLPKRNDLNTSSTETSEHETSTSSDEKDLKRTLKRLKLQLEIERTKKKLQGLTESAIQIDNEATAKSDRIVSAASKYDVIKLTMKNKKKPNYHNLKRNSFTREMESIKVRSTCKDGDSDVEVNLQTAQHVDANKLRNKTNKEIDEKEQTQLFSDLDNYKANTLHKTSINKNIKSEQNKPVVMNDLDEPIPENFLAEIQKKEPPKHNKYPISTPKEGNTLINLDHTSKFTDNLITPKLMVHTKNSSRIKPILTLEDMPFTQDIHQKLVEMGVRTPMTLQTVSWPIILRGHSLFVVNPRRQGKTMGYIPAVCRHVADMKETQNTGPFALIICDTTESVINVAKWCNQFLRKKVVLSFYAGIDTYEFAKNLINDCDILVATPFFICKLFNLGILSLDLKFLSILVIDGCKRIEELYYNEFKFIYKQINKILKIRVNPQHQIQYIVVESQWCNIMTQLSEKLSNTIVCIGYFQECAVYAKPSNVSVVVDDLKMDNVKKFFNEVDSSKRAVVVCNTDEEIENVCEMLKNEKYQVLTGGKSMSIQELYILNQSWIDLEVPCMAPVLVCCDENLRFLNITNAHHLVHYALPSTFTSFCKRFAVCIDSYKSIFEDGDNEVKIEILVDSQNTDQLPKVLNFMKRCQTKIPDDLEKMSEQILVKKDLMKGQNHYPVCDKLLAFGECYDFWYCDLRHTLFSSCDTPPDWLPKNGTVTFKILNFHTPVHYSAVLTSYTVDDERVNVPSKLTKTSFSINLYFSNPQNLRAHGTPRVGDLCVVSRSKNFYERCRVIKILHTDEKGRPTQVLTKLIDEGIRHIAMDIELFHLPDDLKAINTYVMDVRLANVQPKDKDITFSNLAKESIEQKLNENKNLYMSAKVALAIGETIVVNELHACQDMEITNDVLKWCSVKDFLCEKHAETNKNHLQKLNTLCEMAGISTPKEENIKTAPRKQPIKVKPQWAHLESDVTPLVYFSSAENPGHLFVRLVRFEECLDNLTRNIQIHVLNTSETEELQFSEGDFVLALFPDDLQFHRAKINALPCKETNGKYKCFFVDHGDWRYVSKKDVKLLPDSLISVLPFQAIECRLVGLKPVGNEWADWSTNYFYKLCFNEDKELKEVYVKYCVKETAQETGGHKYGIIMIDTHTDEDIIINDVMLNANMAAMKDDEQKYLDNITYEKEKNNKEEEDNKESDDDSFADEEWKREAEPYKNVVYERKVEYLPEVVKTLDESSFASSDGDFDLVNEDVFEEMLLKSVPQITNNLPKLPAPVENDASDASTSRKVLSSSSNYEVIQNLNAQEHFKDSSSSSENSFCITEKISNIALDKAESPKNTQAHHNLTQKEEHQNEKRKPKISWHQTKSNLILKIEVADIDKYKLEIEPRSLTFETIAHETEYSFTVNFYCVVNPKLSSHSPKGLYVLVKLTKLIKTNWLSLTADNVKRKWIVYDQHALGMMEDADSDIENLADMKKQFVNYVEEKREIDLQEEENRYCDDGWDEL